MRFNSIFLSTLSLRRATLLFPSLFPVCVISIHALLAESDFLQFFGCFCLCISIHALLAESDCPMLLMFLWSSDFYPRSPCGERQKRFWQIHNFNKFLSTLSLRRATACWYIKEMIANISIHALLAESDKLLLSSPKIQPDFYPRSPCGERHRQQNRPLRHSGFLSTLSLRRATHCQVPPTSAPVISIHALLAESDYTAIVKHLLLKEFLSTLSLRRATSKNAAIGKPTLISIHALLAESDSQCRTLASGM